MNQPQNPVPPRGARPQLFNAPASTTANAKRHSDFGPSILATIDGGQARYARRRDRLPGKGLLIVGALALMGAAAYLGVKFSVPRAVPEAAVAAAPAPAPAPVLKAVEAAPPASQAVAVQEVAAIETVVAAAAPAPASAASQPGTVAASLNNIQLALDRSEPARSKKEAVTSKEAQTPRRAPPAANAKPSTKKPTLDDDADLLAAMLPHLKRSVASPTSPAYEKRCGQLAGEAAANCRAKFCSEKQGADAACPAAAKPAQK